MPLLSLICSNENPVHFHAFEFSPDVFRGGKPIETINGNVSIPSSRRRFARILPAVVNDWQFANLVCEISHDVRPNLFPASVHLLSFFHSTLVVTKLWDADCLMSAVASIFAGIFTSLWNGMFCDIYYGFLGGTFAIAQSGMLIG
jgi:hypothetical protein